MGGICGHSQQNDEVSQTNDPNRNSLLQQLKFNQNISIDLIMGSYKQHRGDVIIEILENEHLQYSKILKEYCSDANNTKNSLLNNRKNFVKVPINNKCLYKKAVLCLMPIYYSNNFNEYCQQFRNLANEIWNVSNDITFEFLNTNDSTNTLPNQLILSILLAELNKIKKKMQINLITNEKKMMALYKYQLLKTQKCLQKNGEQIYRI